LKGRVLSFCYYCCRKFENLCIEKEKNYQREREFLDRRIEGWKGEDSFKSLKVKNYE